MSLNILSIPVLDLVRHHHVARITPHTVSITRIWLCDVAIHEKVKDIFIEGHYGVQCEECIRAYYKRKQGFF